MCECCTQIDLSGNELCSVNTRGQGTYNADGIKAIAHAISVSASLTSIDLRYTKLGLEGANHIAQGISVSTSLTAADLRFNCLIADASRGLCNAVKDRASFKLVL